MMTKAQRSFVNYYIGQDFRNATQAYMRAFPRASEESARRNASRLLTNADILEYLSGTLAEIIEREKIPLEKRILDYWTRRAFYDVSEILDDKGALVRPLAELSRRGLSVCIDGIETRVNAQGNETTRIRLADRDKVLEQLQRYIEMIKPQMQKVEIAGLSDEAQMRLALLYTEETQGDIAPAVIEQKTDAPDEK